MAALDSAPPEGGRPPPRPDSDTASASSEAASGPHPPRPAPLPHEHHETLDQTDAFPELSELPEPPELPKLPELPPLPPLPPLSKRPPPSPRSRSVSLAQISGPIKRKPLSSTASPVAVRYSTRAYADAFDDFSRPEQRFARSCSLDSPTLYEFPDHRSLLATSALNNVSWPASPDSSQPYVLTRRLISPG